MGRAAKFSSQQIIQAGLDIEKNGQVVSGFSIRNSLGGGAHRRIEEVWKQYDENRVQSVGLTPSNQEAELAIEVQEMLAKTMQDITTQLEGLLAKSCQISSASTKNNFELTLESSRKRIAFLETIEQQAATTLDKADIEIANLHGQVEKLKLANKDLLESKHRQLGIIESLQQHIQRLEKKDKGSCPCNLATEGIESSTQIVNSSGLPIRDTATMSIS